MKVKVNKQDLINLLEYSYTWEEDKDCEMYLFENLNIDVNLGKMSIDEQIRFLEKNEGDAHIYYTILKLKKQIGIE